MLPKTTFDLTSIEFNKNTISKNYKMYMDDILEDYHIKGYCEKLLAMRQVIYKILNTERYLYNIYSWNYGVELMDLYGKPMSYCCPEIERRITEALVCDDRISSVYDFVFDKTKRNIIYATFTVRTIFGDVKADKHIEI